MRRVSAAAAAVVTAAAVALLLLLLLACAASAFTCVQPTYPSPLHPAPPIHQVLPNGHVSPPLFVALRVLCAADAEASSWATIGDALRLPEAAAGAGEGEAADVPDLDAVQVWPVLDEHGRPLAAEAAAEADATAEEQQQAGCSALLNGQMCELLQGAARRRLAAYADSLDADLQQLEQAQMQGGDAAPAAASQEAADDRVARRAALVLRITEKEVLHSLLTALQRRLAALPAEAAAADDGAVAAAAAAPKGKQRQKAGGKQPPAAKAKAAGKRKAAAEPAGGKAPAPRRSGRHRA